ncbi:hypothetical protein GCM10007874_31610 [Labrys miyagiensis]|uniref:Uncharacterized protein n=1 Tax=Labrys miyagiensis TaxID=346912 RepID=A0ABQ6CN47_9HYPH|nr:hypothetical protein [Labrys miyagiensis]GLS20144.1 hypothetical protein GCM10007874_31610 [Labrys miyagiensis]
MATKKRSEITPEEFEARRTKRLARNAAWRARNPERMKEYQRRWGQLNIERENVRRKLWKDANPDKVREAKTRWNRANKASHKAWWDAHKEAINVERRKLYWVIKNRAAANKAFGEGPAKLNQNAVYARVNAAVSRGLPDFVRDDVIAEILLAVLEGTLSVDRIKVEAKAFLRAHNLMFDQFGSVSLDAPVPGTDGLTYGDRLTYEEETGLRPASNPATDPRACGDIWGITAAVCHQFSKRHNVMAAKLGVRSNQIWFHWEIVPIVGGLDRRKVHQRISLCANNLGLQLSMGACPIDDDSEYGTPHWHFFDCSSPPHVTPTFGATLILARSNELHDLVVVDEHLRPPSAQLRFHDYSLDELRSKHVHERSMTKRDRKRYRPL